MKTKTSKYLNSRNFGLAAALAAIAVTGCYNPNGTPDNTGTGALAGGAFGAASGAIIAGPHNAGEGALIGAGAGALLGALIGHGADQQQDARLRQQAPATYYKQAGAPLSLADVKALAGAKVADDTIITQIVNSHTIYHLTSDDIIDLQKAGVSDRIVQFMINTPSTIVGAPTDVSVAAAPPAPPVETVPVIAPGPGYVWVGGEWVWNGGWYWQAGYWGVPPGPGLIWVGGYWGRGPHGWVRYGGHWGHR